MINAVGKVVVSSNNLNENIVILNSNAKIETFKREIKTDINKKKALELTCKYSVILSEDPHCKTLNDYTGKVKPFLERIIKDTIMDVYIYQFDYVPASINHISEVMAYKNSQKKNEID